MIVNMRIDLRKIFFNIFFFLLTLLFAYYFLLMTSNLAVSYSEWDYFILVSFSFIYVFNLCIFWIDLEKTPFQQFVFFILFSPLFTSAALIQNPAKFYVYYASAFVNVFTGKGVDLFTYLKYYSMDKYYLLVFQSLIVIGFLKFFWLVILKKKYK